MSTGATANEAVEVIEVPAGELAAVLEAGGGLGLVQEVQGYVLDHRHVLRAVAGPQPSEVVAEHHVQDPMQPVLDPPVAAPRPSQARGIQLGRAKVVAPFLLALVAALGLGLDHREHGEIRKADLAGMAAVGEQPSHVVADGMAADLEPAMVSPPRSRTVWAIWL
jgi:hypothetical protein